MRTMILLLTLLSLPQAAYSQAVWKGQQYSHAVCNSPNCRMCQSIRDQLASQQRVTAPSPVVAVPYQPVIQQPVIQGEYDLVQVPVVTRVKMCDGKRCWYENVTSFRTERRLRASIVPVASALIAPVAPVVAAKAAAPNLLTNTELVPTPLAAVKTILAELNPNSRQKLFDIGCGDGRFLIEAAKYYGCTTIGIELNAESAQLARQRAAEEFVAPLVTIFEGEAQSYDLVEADFVTMYLYPELMAKLVPKLKPGCTVASYLHDVPGLETVKHEVEGIVFYVGVKK